MESEFKMSIGNPTDGPECVPVLTAQPSLSRTKVLGFDRVTGDLRLQNGATISDYVFHATINLAFPQQIAACLAPIVAYHAVAQATKQQQLKHLYNCDDPHAFIKNKVAAAAFFYGAGKLLAAVADAPRPEEQSALAHFGSLTTFRLGSCGLLADAYSVLDYYRMAIRDTIRIEALHTTVVRWVLWGLMLDPNAHKLQALMQPFLQAAATPDISPGHLYLSSDWRFYDLLRDQIMMVAQRLFDDLEASPGGAKHTERMAAYINLHAPTTVDLSRLRAQIPATPHNARVYAQLETLLKAASLSTITRTHADWCQALRAKFPELRLNDLAKILGVVLVYDPRVTLLSIAQEMSTATALYTGYRAGFFPAQVTTELEWNEESFYLDSMVSSKWIVF